MKQNVSTEKKNNKKINVLIEATKLVSNDRDGIHRYVKELLTAMARQIKDDGIRWHIDVLVGQGIFFSIIELKSLIRPENEPSPAGASGGRSVRLQRMLHIRDVCRVVMENHFPQMISRFRKSFRDPLQSILCDVNPLLKFTNYDLVHVTLPQSHLYFRNCRTRMVTTIHDLTHLHFPQFHLGENVSNANSGIGLAIDKRSEFIAVSNATRNDFLSSHPEILPGSVHVIHEAADRQRFNPGCHRKPDKALRLKYGMPGQPFFLSLSTIEPRKNLTNAIKAFLLMISENPDLPVNFVIAGKKGWADETVLNMAGSRPDRLIFTGFVDDSDLAGLYAEAVALMYVSYYEGFGLPPLEAMSCGTPVVYGNNSAMIEVVGDGGLPADPDDVEDIKEKCHALATDESLRSTLSRNALARSRRFSWEAAAESTLGVYRSVALKR